MDSDVRARRWDLVVRHRERLLPIALARTACRADAEDAVQEAMLRAVVHEDLDETRLRSFLTAVTVRLCVDQHRARQRELRGGTAVLHGEIADPGPEPLVCDQAEAAWAATVLATLPERQREVVAVRARGADLAETARQLHLSYKSVESALSRARAAVRAATAAGACALVAAGRRARVAAVPATAVAAALSVTAAVVVGGATGGPPAPRVVTATPRHDHPAVAAPAGPGGARPGTAGAAGGAAATAGRESSGARPSGDVAAARAPEGAPTERLVYVPGPGDNDVEVTVQDTEETTAQMAERCATGGYTIENGSGRCTKQEHDPDAYPLSDALSRVVPTEGPS